MALTIKQTYRTKYMAIDVCQNEETKSWLILMTKCPGGQITENYKTWNECQKGLSKLLWLTNAIKAPRKSPA